jgi:hypothetical protein
MSPDEPNLEGPDQPLMPPPPGMPGGPEDLPDRRRGYRRRELSVADRVLLAIASLGGLARRLLRTLRSLLPPTWQAQLSDELLGAILLGAAVLLLAIWQPLSRPASPPVAFAPSPAQPEVPAAAPEDRLPLPLTEISPEQTPIADLQEQVAEITQSYAAGLIETVQARFQQGALQVDLGLQWYDLSRQQQQQLAQDIYGRAEQLEFSQLYLFDSDGTLVARSPVVGSQMVILQGLLAADVGAKPSP